MLSPEEITKSLRKVRRLSLRSPAVRLRIRYLRRLRDRLIRNHA